MRVLFAPRNISGQATEMAEAVRLQGHDAQVWSFGPPAFGFQADRVFDRDRLLTHPEYRWSMFDDAVKNFDVFHFMYSRSLLDPFDPVLPAMWDIPLLKFLGKRVFMHYRGSDVRLPSIHRQREPDSYFNDSPTTVDEEAIRQRISIARRHCDALLVSTPGLIDYVPDALLVPHTLDVEAWSHDRPAEPRIPLVVHVPSNPQIKGTAAVDAALEPLNQSGVIRYRRLESLDRAGIHQALNEADIVVDSLRIGDHGLIATEAMASGCIAIAHIHPQNRDRTPGVPVIEATAETLAETVSNLASSPDLRAVTRQEGIEWVDSHNSYQAVGMLLDSLYRRPPAEPQLHRPDWPIEAGQRRIAQLERDLERLNTSGHELYAGWVPPARRTPRSLTDRLTRQIRDLEKQVTDLGGEVSDPIGDRPLGRPDQGTSIRRVLKNQPTVHLWTRRIRKRFGQQ
jgi:hypothetical protein